MSCAFSISFTYLSARVGTLDPVLIARRMAAQLDLRFGRGAGSLLVVAGVARLAGASKGATGQALVSDGSLAGARQLLATAATIVMLLKHALLALVSGHLLVRHCHEALARARSTCHLVLLLEVLADD